MQFVPNHRIEFECVDDVKIEIPSILNPFIEFKEGVEFTLKRPYENKPEIEEIKFVVTGRDITLYDYIDGELHIKVYVRKL